MILGKTGHAMDAHEFFYDPEINRSQQALTFMNNWWQQRQASFQGIGNNEFSNQQIGLLFQLIRQIVGIANITLDDILQACQDATNLIKNNNQQLVLELQTITSCILYINREIIPLYDQAQNQWAAPFKMLKQTIKLQFHQYKLTEIQQKRVLQVLRSIYNQNEPNYNGIRAVFTEISDELIHPRAQPIERAKITNNQQPLQNKDAELQWNTIFRNQDDDKDTKLRKANDLVANCYISVDMQDAVLSLFDKAVIINAQTGKVKGLPNIEAVIDKSVRFSNVAGYKNKITRALRAAYQAVEIAIFIASTEQLYSQKNYIYNSQNNNRFIAILKEKKGLLENLLFEINPTWSQNIWKTINPWNLFGKGSPKNVMHDHVETTPETTLNQNLESDDLLLTKDDLVLTKTEIQRLLSNNNINNAHNYKLISLPKNQADLLFEQCFIAQQHHTYFAQFANLDITSPSYRPARAITVPSIIEYAQKLEDRDLLTLHQLLLDTRLAIQTALDIATRNSDYIGSSILNPVYIRDPLVAQLQSYDAIIAKLISDPMYGADNYDRFYAPMRDYITLGLIKGTYFAGAALAAYVTIYGAYQHGETLLTTAYIPFHATTPVMSWLFSTIKNITNVVTNTTNKIIDNAVQPFVSLNEQVFGPKNSFDWRYDYEDNIGTHDWRYDYEDNIGTPVKTDASTAKKPNHEDSIIKNITNVVTNTTNKIIDNAVQPFVSLNELVFGPKNSFDWRYDYEDNIGTPVKTDASTAKKPNHEDSIKISPKNPPAGPNHLNSKKSLNEQKTQSSTKPLEKNLPTPQQTKEILKNIQNAIDPKSAEIENIYNMNTDNQVSRFLPSPDESTTKQVNSYIDTIKQYFTQLPTPQQPSPPTTQEAALWDSLATGTYDIDYNAKNTRTNKNIATGLTPEENKQFAPYAAGALATGVAGLGGAIAIESIGAAGAQGVSKGLASFGAPTVSAVTTPATTNALTVIPTTVGATTSSTTFGAGLTSSQIAAGGGLAGGTLACSTKNLKPQPISPTNPPSGPQHFR